MDKNKIKYKYKKEKNKKPIYIFAIIIILIISLILFKINYKSKKYGNNISNKTSEEITEYILNISSYSTTIGVTIESNKNSN